MSTGHDQDTTGASRAGSEEHWVRAFLAQPVEHEPGTHFVYNSGATYMVSAIVQKVTGQTAARLPASRACSSRWASTTRPGRPTRRASTPAAGA